MSTAHRASGPPDTNPYLAARREWNERYGDYIATANTWRLVAFASLLIALCAVGGVVWIGAQSKFIPYVVKVDKLGDAVAVGPASEASPVDPRVVTAELARWIYDVRTVYADGTAERKLITEAYAFIGNSSPAYQAMNHHFARNDPFKRAADDTVSVQVQSVLPLSNKTWQLDWQETVNSRNGQSTEVSNWQADVTIAVQPPTDAAAIIANPMGIYVTSFSWSKRL